MDVLQAIVLGLVQGFTEFLPVSSSGHLVIFQTLMGVNTDVLAFDVALHLGTLVPIFIIFWKDIWELIKKPWSRTVALIIVGCVPAGLAGILFKDYIENAFSSIVAVGIGLLITGLILKVSETVSVRQERLNDPKVEETASFLDVILVGLLQAIAILPGISRSGSTISGGLLVGFDREFAARFSFLMSIPVILGAAVLQFKDILEKPDTIHLAPFIAGFATAAISGYVAIKLVINLVKKARLSVFSYYCWVVGLAIILVYAW